MIQAIFYKEWIKTRWYLLLATLFMIGGHRIFHASYLVVPLPYRESIICIGGDGPEGCYIY